MKIAFTICSNNYFAQAKVLLQSIANTNSNYTLVLGLVDKKADAIDYTIKNGNVSIIEVSLLDIPKEYNIFKKYNIIELNTSVKASYIKWIKKNYPEAEQILYFDPDIKVFSSLKELEAELKVNSIVLTPHIYKPIPIDAFYPSESSFLNHGIFNLGFIGISFQNNQVYDFLDWWEERLMKQCFIDQKHGIFVDQLPVNYAPIFYREITKILFHDGMNVAPWNLHERKISIRNNEYCANEDNLVFFHFSSICFDQGKHPAYNRYDLYPILEELHEVYRKDLKENRFLELKSFPCYYKLKPVRRPLWKQILKGITPPIVMRVLKISI